MKTGKKIFRKYLIFFVSIPTLAIALACGWGGDYYDENPVSFFAPEVSKADGFSPFYLSSHYLYTGVNDPFNEFRGNNVAEWSGYFNNNVPDSSIRYLLYEAKNTSLDSLIHFMKGKNAMLPKSLSTNSILLYSDKQAVTDFLFFLGFANRCAEYMQPDPNRWIWGLSMEKSPDSLAGIKLFEGGLKQYKRQKSDFVKQRYMFQLIRLLYNTGKYSSCISLFNEYAASLTQESMKYRSMGYAAGAHYKIKEYASANYMYSILYDRYDQMKVTAWQSFHPQEEKDWNECLVKAKSPREKCVLWHLLGCYGDPKRGMEEIIKIDPKSELVDLLVTRLVNELERNLPLINDESYGYNKSALKIGGCLKDKTIVTFFESIASKDNTHDPALWRLSAGYINQLSGEYQAAESWFKKAAAMSSVDSIIHKQISLLRFISKVDTATLLNPAFENSIVNDLNRMKSQGDNYLNLRVRPALDWAKAKLAAAYKKNGDVVKSHLINHQYRDTFYSSPEKRKLMLAYMNKKNMTAFDDHLLHQYMYRQCDIFELEAVWMLYNYNFIGALKKFKECPGSGDTKLYGDPFLIHINDCHDCDHADPKKKIYTKLQFTERMVELEKLATKTDVKNAAKHYFEYANGLYNMTYYGNGRKIRETTIYCPDDYGDDTDREREPYTNCSIAEKYYLKAAALSNDKEFKAKCVFMAAKCEQNEQYSAGNFDGGSETHFLTLKDSFADTKYYLEIIKECGYFRAYLK